MTKPSSIMIFAAGHGTRMRPLTDDCPKPLIKVDGKALIDHAMDLLAPLNLTTKVVNLHYKASMLRDHFSGTDVRFSDETDHLLETGGGLRHAIPLLGSDPVLTLNTDAVWLGENPLKQLERAWKPSQMDALLFLIQPQNAIGHQGAGDFEVDDQGRLTRGTGPIYAGAQIIKTDLLHEVQEAAFSLNVIWDKMLTKGRLFGLVSENQWCDVGQPASIPLAEAMLRGADV